MLKSLCALLCACSFTFLSGANAAAIAFSPAPAVAQEPVSIVASAAPKRSALVESVYTTHYSFQQRSQLEKIVQGDLGLKVSDYFLWQNYSSFQCRGYIAWTMHRAYDVHDRAIFDLVNPYQIFSPHYLLKAQFIYTDTSISPLQLNELFADLSYGDVLQMRTTKTWHSAIYLGHDENGVTFLDANYDWDNVVQVHTVPWDYLAGSLSSYGMGISGYHIIP